MTIKINVLKDLQEHMNEKYAITGLTKYRDYYAAIGEAIGEMQAVDRLVKKNNALEKALELASDFIHSQDICPVENCKLCGPNDEGGDSECYGDGCSANLGEYYKRKAGIEVAE